jgi:hypothetical protein
VEHVLDDETLRVELARRGRQQFESAAGWVGLVPALLRALHRELVP